MLFLVLRGRGRGDLSAPFPLSRARLSLPNTVVTIALNAVMALRGGVRLLGGLGLPFAGQHSKTVASQVTAAANITTSAATATASVHQLALSPLITAMTRPAAAVAFPLLSNNVTTSSASIRNFSSPSSPVSDKLRLSLPLERDAHDAVNK